MNIHRLKCSSHVAAQQENA